MHNARAESTRRTKTNSIVLKKETSSSAHTMKEENVADHTVPVTFLVLIEERNTNMQRLTEEVVLVCYKFDFYFQNLVERHACCQSKSRKGNDKQNPADVLLYRAESSES